MEGYVPGRSFVIEAPSRPPSAQDMATPVASIDPPYDEYFTTGLQLMMQIIGL